MTNFILFGALNAQAGAEAERGASVAMEILILFNQNLLIGHNGPSLSVLMTPQSSQLCHIPTDNVRTRN